MLQEIHVEQLLMDSEVDTPVFFVLAGICLTP